jgi:crossover junction endodeoxyribonuclease RuvC
MARKSARRLWTEKIDGEKQNNFVWGKGDFKLGEEFYGRILGIDPSLRSTGLAVLDFNRNKRAELLFRQTIKLKPKLTMPDCLAAISRAIDEVISKYPLDCVAVEQTIYVQNFQTAQILGAARGAAIAAAALRDLPITEYPPLRIKQAVVGYGRASKEQVARTVGQLLGIKAELTFDEADAASVALCHALTYRA